MEDNTTRVFKRILSAFLAATMIGVPHIPGVAAEPEETVVSSDIVARGDVNGDGKVNSNDAIHLLRHTMSPDRFPLKG